MDTVTEVVSPWKKVYELETRLTKARRALAEKRNAIAFKEQEIARLKNEIDDARIDETTINLVLYALTKDYEAALFTATYMEKY